MPRCPCRRHHYPCWWRGRAKDLVSKARCVGGSHLRLAFIGLGSFAFALFKSLAYEVVRRILTVTVLLLYSCGCGCRCSFLRRRWTTIARFFDVRAGLGLGLGRRQLLRRRRRGRLRRGSAFLWWGRRWFIIVIVIEAQYFVVRCGCLGRLWPGARGAARRCDRLARFRGGGLLGRHKVVVTTRVATTAAAAFARAAEGFAVFKRGLFSFDFFAARVDDGLVFPLLARFLFVTS